MLFAERTAMDKKIEARILSVLTDMKPWQAVHEERKIRRSALNSQRAGRWDNAEYAAYCHGCGALSDKLNKDYLTGGVLRRDSLRFFVPEKGRRKMSKKAGTVLSLMAMVFMGALASPLTVLAADAEETYQPALYATIWALLPPLVAIILALITKEVYSSLFVGIVVGALLYSGFKFEGTVTQIFEGGIIKVLSDSYNVGILIFLVILGSVVCMMNKAGGSAAFGRWASQKIHTRVGAELAAIILGILIFIDDYFNCLTVGSVMRPVTDRHHVSRAKFAYLIDATAAPVCIIAPISSWAAAVSGFVEGQDGLAIFVRTIPYNFYAILTIVMICLLYTSPSPRD